MRIFVFLACFLLIGCKSISSTETIADGAKETVSGIYESLPKECQSKMTEMAFDGAVKQIESVKANCSLEKRVLNEKIRNRNLLIVVLVGLVLCLIYRKVRQFLSRII